MYLRGEERDGQNPANRLVTAESGAVVVLEYLVVTHNTASVLAHGSLPKVLVHFSHSAMDLPWTPASCLSHNLYRVAKHSASLSWTEGTQAV